MNKKLTMDELQYVQNEVKLKGKNLGLAYTILTFFGLFGIHYAYLEKGKIALMRIMLTVITVASLSPVKTIVYKSETEGLTIKLQMLSSSLLVLQVVLLSMIIAWTFFDFIKLPTMIRIKNEEIEKISKEKVIQSRNVIAKIREEEVSKLMIEKISEKLEKEINIHSEEIVKDFSKKLEELNESKFLTQKEETIRDNKSGLTQKDPITVSEALTKKNGHFSVKGYVVGSLDSNGQKTSATYRNESNVLIADIFDESNVNLDKTLVIQVNSKLQKDLNSRDTSLIGKEIVAEGKIKNYYGRKGLKEVSNITIKE